MNHRFTNPFRYTPHPLVRDAANIVISDLDKRIREGLLPEDVCTGFKAGKMLGVLVCESENPESGPAYLAGFSGSVGGCSMIEGFVPPIFDLMDPEGYYKQQEEKITDLNDLISELQNASEYHDYKRMLWQAEAERESELMTMRERMAESKKDRDRRRAEGCDPKILIWKSQHEKAEFKRLKVAWDKKLEQIKDELAGFQQIIDKNKQMRASMSDALQEWLFNSYKVHIFLGEESSILEIFASQGLTPPGGTGECAAPKLLEHAYKMGLKPLAMGEFWYGTSPVTAVRTHGHFYPSCTSKCGPLLGFMLKGLEIEDGCTADIPEPVIIYEDKSIIAASKPSGMPSVPGLDGKISLQEWLIEKYGEQSVHAVHRLDMDTSGIILFAKTAKAAVKLQSQFEGHGISKEYLARLCPCSLEEGQHGSVMLALSADYDERPRQKADRNQGKYASTLYTVLGKNTDGTVDIAFYPVTGRTHQLRVHSAHHLGLGSPILGDMLYGGQCTAFQDADEPAPKRLHLHARSISFTHPTSGKEKTISTMTHCFNDLNRQSSL